MTDQVAGLRIDVNTDSVETADQRLARFTDRAAMSESQIRNLEAVAKRNSETFESAAIRFGQAADKYHGIADASGQATDAANKNSDATGRAADAANKAKTATGAHSEELTRLQRVMELVNEKQNELAGGLGTLGQVMSAIGPIGFGIAVAFGAIYEASHLLTESAERMSKVAKELDNFATISGLTTTQLQALNEEASGFGLTTAQVGIALTKFSQEMVNLRDGSGILASELRKIDPELLSQISVAETASEQINILAEAYEKAGASKNKLAQAAFGRSSAQVGGLLGEVADKGGVDGLVKSMNSLDIITVEQTKHWKELGDKIESETMLAKNNIASIYTSSVLESNERFARGLLDISRSFKSFAFSDDFKKLIEFFTDPKVLSIATAILAVGGIAAFVAGAFVLGAIATVGAASAGAGAVVGAIGARGDNPVNHGEDVKADTTAVDQNEEAHKKLVATLGLQATASRLLTAALGGAATPTDQLNTKTLALKQALENGELGLKGSKEATDAYGRALAGLNLDAATASISARVGALGAAASETDLVTQKTLALAKANQQGAGLSDSQIANQIRLVQEQYSGVAAVKAQTDAAVVSNNVIGMSVGHAAEYTAIRTKLNEAIRNGNPLNEAATAALEKEAKALGDAAQATAEKSALSNAAFESATLFMSDTEKNIAMINRQLHGDDWAAYADSATASIIRINAQQKSLVDLTRSSLTSFATDFVTGMTRGGKIMDNLGAAAKNLSATLTSTAFTNLFKGDFIGAAAAGVGALVTGIFAGREADRQAEEKAQQDALDRANAYKARTAAAVEDTTTLIGQLQKFDSDADAERAAEAAKGGRALVDLEAALQAERVALIQKAAVAAQDAFDQLVRAAPTTTQAALKSLTDAAIGLANALGALGQSVTSITEGVNTAVERLQHNFADGLVQKINTAFGADYLTSVISLARQHTADLADAATLGINASLVNTAFSAQVQKLIDDGKIAGQAFQGIIDLFPELSGSIHEFSSLASDSAQALTDAVAAAQTALTAAQNAEKTAENALTTSFQTMLSAATSALSQSVNNLVSVYKTQFDTAQSNVVSAYNAQTTALQATIDKMNSYVTTLKNFQNSLNVGSLSTLNPTDQLGAARSQFEQTSALANTGDSTALAALQGVSQTYLDQAKSYFASTKGYSDAFKAVQDALSQAQDAAKNQISDAEKQMALLREQVKSLGIAVDDLDKINSNTMIMISALGEVGADTSSLDANGKALNSAIAEYQKVQVLGNYIQQQYGITIDTSVKVGSAAIVDAINSMLQSYQVVADAVQTGNEIERQTGIDVFAGINAGTKNVVDAVNSTSVGVMSAVGGVSLGINTVNGSVYGVISSVNGGTLGIANAVTVSGANLAIATYDTAANVYNAIMNLNNSSLNGNAAVVLAVSNLKASNDNLITAEQALLQANNNQTTYLASQLATQASQLGQLIILNSNVLTLNATVAKSANTTPAASNANDAAAAAAAAAADAAKTWHYPALYGATVGEQKVWALEGISGPLHAAYRAAHPEARYELGGVVSNGTWGKDSVNAMLAGGEFVMPAPQTAQFMPQLEAMRSGNGGFDNEKMTETLVRALAAISMGEIEALRADNAALREQMAMLINAVRGNKQAPSRPNSNNGLAA